MVSVHMSNDMLNVQVSTIRSYSQRVDLCTLIDMVIKHGSRLGQRLTVLITWTGVLSKDYTQAFNFGLVLMIFNEGGLFDI